MRSIGYELPLTLDASASSDPDVPGDISGITFKWMCRKKEEDLPTTDPDPNGQGGCWENGTYGFGGNSRQLVVYTGDFSQRQYYNFRLTISKDSREAHFDQMVEVLVGQPPTMVIV